MFWIGWVIITTIIWIVGSIVFGDGKLDDILFTFIAGGLLWLVVNIPSCAFFIVGIHTYPFLLSQKQEILSLKSEIIRLRKLYYGNENNPGGFLLKGDIANIELAKEISQYVKEYAKKRAEFNKGLKYIKTIRKILVYRLFWYAFFINPSVDTIKPLPSVQVADGIK